MSKILKNTTGIDIDLIEIGLTVPASGQITVPPEDYLLLSDEASVVEITALINSGSIILNDGINNISTVEEMIAFLRYPDSAKNSRFLSNDEIGNNFNSKNTQDAIEEARNSAIGTLLQYSFTSTGNTSDKWMSFSSGTSAPSNSVPMIVPQDSVIKGITFANQDDNVDVDIEIYRNGLLVYTEMIRNKRLAWIVGNLTISFSQGDRLSVFLRKVTNGTGDNTAQNPEVILLGKFINEKGANSGTQYGV